MPEPVNVNAWYIRPGAPPFRLSRIRFSTPFLPGKTSELFTVRFSELACAIRRASCAASNKGMVRVEFSVFVAHVCFGADVERPILQIDIFPLEVAQLVLSQAREDH